MQPPPTRALIRVLLCALPLSGCASSDGFVSSWKDPDAKTLQLRGAKVAAADRAFRIAELLQDGIAARLRESPRDARELTLGQASRFDGAHDRQPGWKPTPQ